MEEERKIKGSLVVRKKWFKDSWYYKDNQTSKESVKTIVIIQGLRISIGNIVKIKELNSKNIIENTGIY